MSHARGEQLLAALQRQQELYQVLKRVASRQLEVLRSGQTDQLVELVEAKQAELARVESIDAQIGELKSGWRDWRGQVAMPLRDRIEQELAALSQVLQQLIDLEAEGEQSVRAGMSERTEVLRQIEAARKLQQAYGGAAVAPRWIDQSR
jgi:hypothetical protein